MGHQADPINRVPVARRGGRTGVRPGLPAALFLALAVLAGPPTEGSAAPAGAPPALDALAAPPDTGRIVGFVREGEEGPGVSAAVVSIEGPEERSGITDDEGYFRFELLTPGTYTIRAEHLAFTTVEVEVEVAGESQTTRVEIRLLPEAIALEPIHVEVEGARPTFGPLVQAYERVDRQRMLGLGRILTREDLERRVATRLSDLLSTMPGVRVEREGEQQFARARMTGGAQRLRETCYAALWVDGVRVLPPRGDMGDIDEFVMPSEIEILEVYRGAAQVPPEYGGSDAQCGVVAVWTRRGS